MVIEVLLCACLLAMLIRLAVVDARRLEIEPRAVLAFGALALLWRLQAADWELPAETVLPAVIVEAVLGALLGAGTIMAPILWAELRGRRWPVYPGDAMLLGAFGVLLGPLGLLWAMVLGCLSALVQRAWVQRRRGRPFARGYLPLAPGLCLGCLLAFAGLEADVLDAGRMWASEPRRSVP